MLRQYSSWVVGEMELNIFVIEKDEVFLKSPIFYNYCNWRKNLDCFFKPNKELTLIDEPSYKESRIS